MSTKTYPIILAHGIARFDVLSRHIFNIDNRDAYDGLHYFRNIRTHLQSHGFRVRHTNVDWADSIHLRARSLKRQIEELITDDANPAGRVHIIAHSMGGLDARRMLFDFHAENFHEHIASLTTIATPHHGSPIADSVIDNTGQVLAVLGLSGGAQDLTTSACAAFNAKAASWERSCGVHFRAHAGQQDYPYILDLLKPAGRIINAAEGPNDGLVSVKSAKWDDGYFVDPVLDADHFNLCGWWDPAELRRGLTPNRLEQTIKAFYLGIAEHLATEFPITQ